MIRSQVITAAVVLDNSFFGQTSGGSIFDGRARYQIECNNASKTGTATVEIDFGAGYRLMKTIDLTDVSRVPYTIEAEIVSARVTPSQSMTLAVGSERP